MKNSYFIFSTAVFIFTIVSSGFLFGGYLTEQLQLETQYITKHYTLTFEKNITLFPDDKKSNIIYYDLIMNQTIDNQNCFYNKINNSWELDYCEEILNIGSVDHQ